MIGGKITGFISQTTFRQRPLADHVGKVTGIDSHRAGHGAEAVSGTGLVSGIFVLLFQ